MNSDRYHAIDARQDDLSGLCRIGGIAAFCLIAYCLATIVQLLVLGAGVPPTAAGVFGILHTHRIEGLLRLDLATVLVMPLYYLLFLGLFAALRRVDQANTVLATTLAFAGTTLVLATPTALPLLSLSDKYWAATSDAVRAQFLAAGEALMSSDIWHATGAMVGGVLVQSGAVLICCVMLRGGVFSRTTAWLGIVMHGIDLAHTVLGPFAPMFAAILMALAGLLYPVWFFLIGRRLLQLAAGKTGPAPSAPVASHLAG